MFLQLVINDHCNDCSYDHFVWNLLYNYVNMLQMVVTKNIYLLIVYTNFVIYFSTSIFSFIFTFFFRKQVKGKVQLVEHQTRAWAVNITFSLQIQILVAMIRFLNIQHPLRIKLWPAWWLFASRDTILKDNQKQMLVFGSHKKWALGKSSFTEESESGHTFSVRFCQNDAFSVTTVRVILLEGRISIG